MFDPNKYRQIAQQELGPNAFNFNHTANRYALEAEASRLRDKVSGLINDRIKQINSPKKTYQDAVNYWNQNKALFQKQGAYNVANDIKNDPAKQAEIKAQGYNVEDYLNGLYHAASGGKFRSQREFNQYNSQLKKDISARDKAYKKQHGGMSQDQVYAMKKQANKPKPKGQGVIGNIEGLFKDLGHGVSQRLGETGDELSNIWKAVSDGPGGYTLDNVANATQADIKKRQKADAKRGYSSTLSKEVQRGANRAVDAATLGNMSAYQNAENAKGYGFNTNYANTRQFGKGGATDFLTSGIGYLAPGSASLDLAKGLGLGEKVASKLADKGASNAVQRLGNLATEGATTGGIFGGMQSIADPNMTLKQRLENVPLNAALGAVADPLLHVAGTKIAQFFGKDKVAKSELDSALNNPNTPNDVKQEILALPEPKVAGYLNEGQRLALPEPKTSRVPRYESPTNQSSGETLALPPHNPSANEILDYLLPKIKPEIEQAMTPPLENPRELKKWIREHTDIPVKQLDTLPPKDLHDMAIHVRNSLRLPDVAQEVAHKYGYDLHALLNGQVKDLNGVINRRNFAETAGIPQNKLNMDILNNPQVGTTFKPKERYVPMDNKTLNYVGKNTQPLSLKVQPVTKETPPLNFSRKAIVDKSNPEVANRIKQSLNPKNEAAATVEKVATKKEPKYVNATSNDGGKLVKAVENNIPNANKLKDLKPRQIHWQDPMRNLRQVLGKAAEPIINGFDKAKGQLYDFQKQFADKLNKDIVQGLGIKKGSKESALVQRYGEGDITLDELKQLAPNKWKDIVKADQWFKQQYDSLLNEVNNVRSKLYPNQPDKLVPKRDNYYRHFRDLNGLQGIKNLFETPAGIDPHLVGASEFTKPNSKFASFMQKRGLGPYKNDAVGGFLDYLPAAGYAKYIDPQIKVFNQLKNDLATQTESSKNLNHFLTFLDRFSQDLAGKTNPADRWVQENVSRKAFRIVNALNSRIKSNVILGNVGSALSQVANIPQGVAFAKQYSVKGAGKTLLSIFHESPEMSKSTFLKERYHHKIYRQFDTKLLQQPKKFAEWMMETADRIGTSFVWNSAYTKAVAKNIKDPVKYADNATRDLVAGRGIGEVPIAQKSKLVQLIAPFQLEVGNLWKVQKGFVKQKDFGALITFYLAAHLMNKGFEQLRGTSIIFDPIQAIQDASKDNLTFTQRAGRVMGEILSNMPMGQTIAAEYPQYGFKDPITGKKMPTRKQLFGDNDPTRFGTGIANVLSSGLKDPAFKILPPFGGYQAEKTFKALQDLKNKGHYNKDKSKLSYPVTPSGGNIMKGLLFGPSAISNAQEYYNKNRRPLSANQTKDYKSSLDKAQFYKELMKLRKEKSSGK